MVNKRPLEYAWTLIAWSKYEASVLAITIRLSEYKPSTFIDFGKAKKVSIIVEVYKERPSQ